MGSQIVDPEMIVPSYHQLFELKIFEHLAQDSIF